MVFRFEDVARFSAALGEARGSLPLPDGETVTDGEWVLAIFEIGSKRRATAAAARAVCAAGDTHVAFERRDWDRLLQFVAAREAAAQPKSGHLRAARPVGSPSSSNRIPVASITGASGSDALGLSAGASGVLGGGGALPSVASPSIEFSDNDNPPSSVVESSRLPFGARILLVDDDAEAREELRSMLSGIGLYVEVAETAAEAQASVARTAFDALVLDFHTPDMGPIEFVRSLPRDHAPARGPLPVLFVSSAARGLPSSREVVEAVASGADDFLPKPFRAPELAARIFGLLRRARLAKNTSIAPGPTSSRGGGGSLT